ncbi:galactose-1-phosphate uridylyltransferase [Corynebacterium aquatimens]|uniref:galactose-1-phosphate uridylyltransferase n=1 Tax=Corynebacterium aquatimens TaxID=1190508 RepID=UPI0018CA058F|nr:galactose-1-phosphate uridylyltransferase [Corynebacterium aquatimens]
MKITRTQLSDGRELIYYDTPGTPDRTAVDERDLPEVHTESWMRQDPLTGEWAIYAAHRQNRTFLPPANEDPLAPTREGQKPSEIPESDYQVVVFENRFPSLSMRLELPDGWEPTVDGEDIFRRAPAESRCEVVCFTPDAEGSFKDLSLSRKRTLIDVWAHRTEELSALAPVKAVFPFENRGEEIGVTLHHPHGQIYSYPFVPPRAAAIAAQAAAARETGTNLFDEVIAAERRAGTRVIDETEHFLVFTPAAAKWPLEVMVMAKGDVPNFPSLSDAARDDLAQILDKLYDAVDEFFEGIDRTPYIAAWNQAPVDAPADGRLHLQLFSLMRSPGRMKFLAGSESGQGVWINDTTPETIASTLRAAYGAADAADPSPKAGA